MGYFNKRFADDPGSFADASRLDTTQNDPARILTWQEAYTISKGYHQIQSERLPYTMQNAVRLFTKILKNTTFF
jgi:hypothetical protein